MKMKKYNWIAFFLIIFSCLIAGYSLYSDMHYMWLIAPPSYVILLLSILALVLGIAGFWDKSSWHAKLRSWLTIIISPLLIILLCIVILFTAMFSGAKERMETVSSPDGQYTIHFYRTDAGAKGTFGILGELKGPLWFKKKIFFQRRVDQVEVEWENNHTILINAHRLDLLDLKKEGISYSE